MHVCISIDISEYVGTIFFDISVQFLSIYEDGYINVNSLHIKFLLNFFSPDVISDTPSPFPSEFSVLTVAFTQVDDVPNKIEFPLIHACCEFTIIVHLYCFTHNMLISYDIYDTYCIYLYIYAYMIICYNCDVRPRYRV